jgi:hypothetical protein
MEETLKDPEDLRQMPYVRQVADYMCELNPNLSLEAAFANIDQMSYDELQKTYDQMVQVKDGGR